MTTIETDYLQRPDNRDLSGVPGDYGLPILGKALSFGTNPLKVCSEHHNRYGLISRLAMGPARTVLALGPDNAQAIHLDTERNFSSHRGLYRFLRLIGGSLIMKDFEEHRFQRRLMQTAFKKDAMQGYARDIDTICDRKIHWMAQQEEFQMVGAAKSTLLEIAAQTFTGIGGQGGEGDKLTKAFQDFVEGFNFLWEWNIPGFKFHKCLRAKQHIDSFIRDLIPGKRSSTDDDILAHFCRERDEHGNYFSDEDIAENFVLLLFAAQDTTTASLVNACFELGKHPEWQHRCREEINALGKSAVTPEDFAALPSLEMVFNESQRLHASVPLFPRRSIRACELSGVEIPADTPIINAIAYNHIMPDCWQNPLEFDPERFERGEHKQHPFLFHPFGGGAHKCIGMHFAQMVFRIFLYRLLRDYEIQLRPGYDPRWLTIPMSKPADDLPLRLVPLN